MLFNIYINDIPTPENTNVAIYADDTAISAQSWQPHIIHSRLQKALNTLEPWLTTWRVKVNVSKCQALLLSKRRTITHNTPLLLFNQNIHWMDQVKYLGVTLDRKLTWSAHINYTLKRANIKLFQLYPLLNKTSSLSMRTATMLYKSLLMSILTYAAPVWGHAGDIHIRKLQLFQNKVLRIVTKAPVCTKLRIIHKDLNVPFIKQHIQHLAVNLYKGAHSHPTSTLISSLGRYKTTSDKHKQPLSLTHDRQPAGPIMPTTSLPL